MRKWMIAAIALMAVLTMGNTTCNPDDVEVGDEPAAIEAVWDFGNLNTHNSIHRLEGVAKLQQRMIEDLTAKLYERAWFYDCMEVLMDPEVAPNLSQMPVYEFMIAWCKSTYGGD